MLKLFIVYYNLQNDTEYKKHWTEKMTCEVSINTRKINVSHRPKQSKS